MQTDPYNSVCVKASKWALVVFFSVSESEYHTIPEQTL